MDEEDGTLAPATAAWLQDVTDQHFGGNFGRAAAAILEAAHTRALRPDDPWAELDARVQRQIR